ncbi:MAG TPA: V-type ATP synthase subunit I [Thermoplasmata archaeon]|nr:V-type ATP synthase subunit I [Thermoplasmata archaeon]
MTFLRPVRMTKIGVVGLKTDRETVLSVLHDQRVLQVEPLRKEALALFPAEGTPESQRQVADQLLRIRGIKSALPPTGPVVAQGFPTLAGLLGAARAVPIEGVVTALKREEEKLQTERKSVADLFDLLGRFSFYTGPLDFLHLEHLLSFFGEVRVENFSSLRAQISAMADVVFLESAGPETVRFVLAVNSDQAEPVSRLAQQQGVVLTSVPRLNGTIAERRPALERRRTELEARLAEIHRQLTELSTQWYARVASLEEALTIEARKLEVYGRIGAAGTVFALEGWVPTRALPALQLALTRATQERTAFYTVPTMEEPPTLMDNPGWVRRFEFFIRFYSLPQSSEWDPTWIFALAFPLFFGFMLSDIGYGLVILGFSLWMVAGFPGRRHVPSFLKNFLKRIMPPSAMQSLAWTLIPASLMAILFGYLSNEFFGPTISLPGPHWDVRSNLGDLFLVAGFIGLGMVVFGFVLGALKAYYHHHRKEMIARGAGISIAFGLTFLGLQLVSKTFQRLLGPLTLLAPTPATVVELALLILGVVAILYSEGGQGLLALTEILSHILSYLRLVGILLSSVVVAILVNSIAHGLYSSGIAGSVVLGAVFAGLILLGGQIFNVVLAVFEPGIQGARLIFVEHFSKFYSGNGKEFRPFGSRRVHTLPVAVGSATSLVVPPPP